MLRNLLSKSKNEGFTLVEIIIVLAIVGLIFVIIFLAVTAAANGRRDTARKDNVNRLYAVIQQVAGNSATATPPAPATSLAGYTMSDPVTSVCNTSACRTNAAVEWFTGACPTAGGGTVGHVAVLLQDGTTVYCKDY